MKETTCYDAIPDSISTVILDSNLLLIQGAENLIKYNTLGIPVSENGYFKAILGTNDILLLMHYFYHNTTIEQANLALKSFRIADVFNLERPSELQYLDVSIDPDVSLFNAAQLMLHHNQFRAAIVEIIPSRNGKLIKNYLKDGSLSSTGEHVVLSVITNYRMLRTIAKNCPAHLLEIPAKQLMTIPKYSCTLDTPMITVIEMLIRSGVNAIPVLDSQSRVINVYGSPDILSFVGNHEHLDLNVPIEQAIDKRSAQFEGVHTCKEVDTLGKLMQGFQKQSIHRVLVADDQQKLLGVVRLVDIVRFLVYHDL